MTKNLPPIRQIHTEEEFRQYIINLTEDKPPSEKNVWHMCLFDGTVKFRNYDHTKQNHKIFFSTWLPTLTTSLHTNQIEKLIKILWPLKEKLLCRQYQLKHSTSRTPKE